jgi:hypothetical protein
MSPSIRTRTLVTLGAAGVLLGASATIGAPTASASYPSDTLHYCGSLLDTTSDDGPLTDGIHHNVEPLVAGLGLQPGVHGLNCNVLAGVLGL